MASTSKTKHAGTATQAADADAAARDDEELHKAQDGDVAGELEPPDELIEHTIVELLLDALVKREATPRRSNGAPERDPGPRAYEAELIRGRNFVLSRSPNSVWIRPNERVAITAEEDEYLRDSHARQKFGSAPSTAAGRPPRSLAPCVRLHVTPKRH